MIKRLFTLCLMLTAATVSALAVKINSSNFPDEKFRNYLLSQEYGKDGVLTASELYNITVLNVSNKGIQSLLGIEFFTSLKELNCSQNSITAFNLLDNTALEKLNCDKNLLERLNLALNKNLKELSCEGNNIESLNITNSTELTELKCGWNNLRQLDVSQNTKLTYLDCASNNLRLLDVSNNTALKKLDCSFLPNLKSLNLSKNTALELLYCISTGLTSLDVSNNKALRRITCYGSKIEGSGMDKLVNSLPKLSTGTEGIFFVKLEGEVNDNSIIPTQVTIAKGKNWRVVNEFKNSAYVDYAGDPGCWIDEENFPDENFRNFLLGKYFGSDGYLSDDEANAVTEIDCSNRGIKVMFGIGNFKKLKKLNCSGNSLTSNLIVFDNTELEELLFSGCGLTSIYLGDNKKLKVLDCSGNKLTELSISSCTDLESLNCGNPYNPNISNPVKNNFAEKGLNVTSNTKLKTLNCSNCGLKSLNVQSNTALTFLDCSINNLTALNVSKNKALKELYCHRNQINGTNMDNLVNNLPTMTETASTIYAMTSQASYDNTITTDQVMVAANKGWVVMKLTDSNWSSITGIPLTSGYFPDAELLSALADRRINKNEDDYLQPNELDATSLSLNVKNIKDTKGLEYFTLLETLYLTNNSLTKLDVSAHKALKRLDIYGNQIEGTNMDDLINSLPIRPNNDGYLNVNRYNYAVDNIITVSQVAAAKAKGWIAQKWNDNGRIWEEYEGAFEINEEHFPDDNFRNFLLLQDYGRDGILTDHEKNSIKELTIVFLGIKDLTGIEYFPNLERLNCSRNHTEILDISNNKKLKYLDCSENMLESLDITKNFYLETLNCYDNNLTTVKMDWMKNVTLKELYCHRNQISGTGMNKIVNNLQNTIGGNLYVNDDGYYYDNVISTAQVAVAQGSKWKVWRLDNSEWVEYEGALEINAENFPDEKFRTYVASGDVDRNLDGFLSIRDIQAATVLHLEGKEITDLTGIEHFTELKTLHCYQNNLASLDVSKNTELELLNCWGCGLKSLDVSQNTKLLSLYCSANELTSLNVSQNTELMELNCYGNQIKGDEMSILVNSLPEGTGGIMQVNSCYSNPDNIITPAQVAVAIGKGWSVHILNGSAWGNYSGYGDVNGDNTIDEKDLDMLVQAVMGQLPETEGYFIGDLNNDQKTDAADVVIMINILNNK